AQVLAKPVYGEPEVELAGDHRFPAIVHLPALRSAGRDRLEHLLAIETRGAAKRNCLRKTFQHARNRDLIDHLGELTGSLAAEMDDARRIGLHIGLSRLHGRIATAAHDRKAAVL